jgi:hypothetical protein
MSPSESKARVLNLPEMVPAALDGTAVESLFDELAFETTVLEIRLRAPDSAAREGDPRTAPNLRVARDAILSGRASGVQLRYVHEGIEWWDTLMRTSREGDFRVVRVKKPPESSG